MSYWANPRPILFWMYLLFLLRGDYNLSLTVLVSEFSGEKILAISEEGTSNL